MKRSLRSWLWRVPLDQEVDEEIALHIEMRTRELVERGMDPKAAREIVLARIGDLGQLKRTCVDLGRKREREMRMTRWIEELTDDVRFALRQLRRSPGFTLVAAITLALGIGANSAMFALADATLLRPFPFPEPDRLVIVFEKFRTFPRTAVASLNFRDWRDRNRTFQSMAAAFTYPRRMAAPDGTAEEILSQQVTTEFFDVLGIKPIAGRTFLPTDEALPPNVVVLSEGYWRTRFGGDPALIGRTVRIDGDAFTVLGVVPEEAQILSPASIWTVFIELPGMDARGIHFMRVIGRLKPGITIDAARSDMTTVAEGLAAELPATNTDRGVTIDPLRTGLIGPDVRLTSYLLLGVVGFVLLMCCANVANLLLARTNGRARELALRSALGAGRGRIVVQILTESLVLAALGGALGLGVGAVILSVAPSVIPAGLLPPAVILTFDERIVAFCAGTAFLTGLLFGLAPAWQATSASLVQVLSSESRTVDTRQWTIPEPARRRRSVRSGAPAVRRRTAAAHARRPRERERRLHGRERAGDARQPAVRTADVALPHSGCPASILRGIGAGNRARSRSPQRGLDQRTATRGLLARVLRLRHRRRHRGVSQQSSSGRLSDREPGLPSNAGHSTRRRARPHRPGHGDRSAGVSRERRVRSALPARENAAWPAHRHPADGPRTGAADRARNRRRDPARQDLGRTKPTTSRRCTSRSARTRGARPRSSCDRSAVGPKHSRPRFERRLRVWTASSLLSLSGRSTTWPERPTPGPDSAPRSWSRSPDWRCCWRWSAYSACWRIRCNSERASSACASHSAPALATSWAWSWPTRLA